MSTRADPQLVRRIDEALPQTQCTRCGFPDCAGYAQAVAAGTANIDRCPPGGAEGVQRLSRITGLPPLPLNPEYGRESPRHVVFIRESDCIGCTLCITACPTDAIIGAPKWLHSVIEDRCTGCDLCLPACPVDCIDSENASGARTGWQAWSQAQADATRGHHRDRLQRLRRAAGANVATGPSVGAADSSAREVADGESPVQPSKHDVVQAALARARAGRVQQS